MVWKKGQSGNPGGRPKVAPELRAAAQEVSIEGLKVLTGIMRDEKAPQNARINAVQAIWDRGRSSRALVCLRDGLTADSTRRTIPELKRAAAAWPSPSSPSRR